MDERARVGWLHRRAGFGLHPDDLTAAAGRGADTELGRLLDEAGEPPPDPWDGVDLDDEPESRRRAIAAWVEYLTGTGRPFSDRLTWLLHGWLVSSLRKVKRAPLMTRQIGLYMRDGSGGYPDLLRTITVDPAMLVYLDGRTSTGRSPNENYGRELLELFALGIGNYTEDDVKAASRALTGWVIDPATGSSYFAPRRHDPTPQTLLGVPGVNDVDSVIDAVVAQPAHARFVATRLTHEYLGDPGDAALDGVVDELATTYEAADGRLDAVVTRALELGLDGAATRLVVAPVPWLVGAMRSCDVSLRRLGADALRRIPELGQVPMLAPDVSGWPSGVAWFTSSSLLARTHLATAIAERTAPYEPVMVAAADGDLDLLARHLGLAEPFGPSTARALRLAADPVDRLGLALVCPENLLS